MSAVSKAVTIADIGDLENEGNQYLTFFLGGELFAIGILNIKEIIEYGELTRVPMMPEFVRGVINLRGAVVPVIDLQQRFGREKSKVGKRTCIVIIEVEVKDDRQIMGVVVDSVSEVLAIAAEDIEKPPAFGAELRSDFIDGMGKIEEKFIIILNVDNVLSIDEIAHIAEVKGNYSDNLLEQQAQ